MAGGVHAAVVPCVYCAERAVRTSEGQEDDGYECSACGRRFSIDWIGGGGPPQRPCWPPTPEERARILRFRRTEP